MECFRRIALTGLAVFVYPDSSAQIAIVLLLSTIFMVVSEILSPFSCPIEMWLYRTGHYVVFASMFLALLLRVDISDEREGSQEIFSGVIVVAHAAMILVVIGHGLLIFVGLERPEEPPEVPKVLNDCPIVSNSNEGNEEYRAEHSPNPLYGGKETPTTTVRGQGALASTASPPDGQLENRCKSLGRTTPATKSFFVSDLSRPSSSALTLSAFKMTPPVHSARHSQDADRSRRGQSLIRTQRHAAGNTTPLAITLEESAAVREDPPTPTPVLTKSVGDGAHVHETLAAGGLERAKTLSPQSLLSSAAPGERPRSSPVFSGRELFGGRSARWGWTTSFLSADEKSEISELSKCSEDLAIRGRSWSPRGRFFHPTTTATGGDSTSAAVKRVCISPPDRGSRGGIDAAPTPDAKDGERLRAGKRSLISGHVREQIVVSAHPSTSRRKFLSNPEPAIFTTDATPYDLACGGIIVSPAETPRTDKGQETPRSLARSAPRTGNQTILNEVRTPRATGNPRQSFFRSPEDRKRSPLRETKTWVPESLTIDEDNASVSTGRKSRAERSNSRVASRVDQEGQEEKLSRKEMSSGSCCGSLVIGRAELQQNCTQAGEIHSTDDTNNTKGVTSDSHSGGIYTGRRNASSSRSRPAQGVPFEAQGGGGGRGAKSDNKVKIVAAEATRVHEERAGWHPIFRSPTY